MEKDKLDELDEVAKVVSVGQHEADQAVERLDELKQMSSNMSADLDLQEKINANQQQRINDIQSKVKEAQSLLNTIDLDNLNVKTSEIEEIENLRVEVKPSEPESPEIKLPHLDYVDATGNWEDLLSESEAYAAKFNLSLDNPYFACLSDAEINKMSALLADKYELSKLKKEDYVFAGIVGIIGGLVDAFLVGAITDGNNKYASEQGILGQKVDDTVDKLVTKYAEFASRNEPYGKKINSKNDAIRWLENQFKVSYDASNNSNIINDSIAGMNPSNHHLFSLSHDIGPLGLFTSILDQLDGKSTFISDGMLKRVYTASKEADQVKDLQLGPEKVIKAVENWFGHICSAVAGTSKSVGRGAGLPMPFYSITQQFKFGSFDVNGKDKDFAGVAEWLYKQGLDFRAFVAQSIPVLIMETLIRLYWVYKNHFYYGKEWKECIPIANQLDLQTLLLVSTSTFAAVDITDAIIRNGNVDVKILLRINFANAYDLGVRSVQVMKGRFQRAQKLKKINQENEANWNEIYRNI